jgi:hypothetical protein
MTATDAPPSAKSLADWFRETADLPTDAAVERILTDVTDIDELRELARQPMTVARKAWEKTQQPAKARKKPRPGPKQRRYFAPSEPDQATAIDQIRAKRFYFGQQFKWETFDNATPAHWTARIEHQQGIIDTAKNAIATSKKALAALNKAGAASGKDLPDAAVKKLVPALNADTADYYG